MYWDLYACVLMACLAFSFSMIITVSQFYQTIKTKNTSSISILTYILFVLASIICLIWSIACYYKTLMTYPPEDRMLNTVGETLQPYGTYALWQWTLIPIISYYFFDILIGIILSSIKIHHYFLAKRLRTTESALAAYLLKEQKRRLIASGNKIYRRKYFGFAIVLILLSLMTIAVAVLWMLYVTPKYQSQSSQQIDWTFVWVLNLIGAFSCEVISWPQFIKSFKEKDTSGISLNWAIFLPFGSLVTFLYGLSLTFAGSITIPPDTLGALIFNGLIVNVAILILKLKNVHKARKLHISEIEYANRYLIPEYQKKKQAKEKAKHH